MKTIDKRFEEAYDIYHGGDFAKGIPLFLALAKEDYAPAQVWMGISYFKGQGVAQDYETAVQWYLKAAAQGHSGAQKLLGDCYKNGHGVPRDFVKAAECYHKVAVKAEEENDTWGDDPKEMRFKEAEALCDAKQYDKALPLLKNLANAGLSDAMYKLSKCYAYGYGVPKDNAKAEEWHNKAEEKANARIAAFDKALANEDNVW